MMMRSEPMKRNEEELSLGHYLAYLRTTKKLSLRAVEEATDKEVSNAYLSQLEHDRIQKPSPNILYSLAEVYAVPYEKLMEKAGYITQGAGRRVATFAIDENLTPDEEEKLLEYLAFMRSRKGGR